MILREHPLPTPPERPPYFRVAAPDGAELVLRRPSLATMATLLKSIDPDQQGRLFALVTKVGEGASLFGLLLAADEILPLLAALVGLTWADPRLQLETPPRHPDTPLASYGAMVLEELHEQGWEVAHLVLAALAVVDQVQQSAQLSAELAPEVARRTAFFRRPRASTNESGSPSRPTTSDDSEDDPSTSSS